eukprot:SAG11_NODE_4263_length_1981_cov_35.759830_3_plen_150_part_00
MSFAYLLASALLQKCFASTKRLSLPSPRSNSIIAASCDSDTKIEIVDRRIQCNKNQAIATHSRFALARTACNTNHLTSRLLDMLPHLSRRHENMKHFGVINQILAQTHQTTMHARRQTCRPGAPSGHARPADLCRTTLGEEPAGAAAQL